MTSQELKIKNLHQVMANRIHNIKNYTRQANRAFKKKDWDTVHLMLFNIALAALRGLGRVRDVEQLEAMKTEP